MFLYQMVIANKWLSIRNICDISYEFDFKKLKNEKE